MPLHTRRFAALLVAVAGFPAGLIASLGLADLRLVAAVSIGWGLVYASRPFTAEIPLLQWASTCLVSLAVTVPSTLSGTDAAPGLAALVGCILVALLLGTLWFAAWMAPIGMAVTFIRGGIRTQRASTGGTPRVE